MTIDFFTKCLEMVVITFRSFPPLMWVFCCAVICAIAYVIKSFVRWH